jgi:hypothetical protein
MLVHSDIKTTQRYLSVTDEEVRKASNCGPDLSRPHAPLPPRR